MPNIVEHYEIQVEKKEQDAVGLGVEMITLHSKLESAAKNTSKLERDMDHLRQTMNENGRCRHCKTGSNIEFRLGELLPRCVCGTRC